MFLSQHLSPPAASFCLFTSNKSKVNVEIQDVIKLLPFDYTCGCLTLKINVVSLVNLLLNNTYLYSNPDGQVIKK